MVHLPFLHCDRLLLCLRTIRDTISAASENVAALEKQCSELKADETALAAKVFFGGWRRPLLCGTQCWWLSLCLGHVQIKKKTADLERNEKRLKSLQSVRPAFMDEYESLEKQLAEQYAIYLERFRNLDYLEHELDLYHQVKKPSHACCCCCWYSSSCQTADW